MPRKEAILWVVGSTADYFTYGSIPYGFMSKIDIVTDLLVLTDKEWNNDTIIELDNWGAPRK